MQINWQQMRRLLVIFIGNIETEFTFLHATLQKIRETTINAEITLLLSKKQNHTPFSDSQLPTLDSRFIDRIISHTTTWQDPAREKKLVENLRQFEFDAAIILTGNNESPYPFAYLAYLAGIPIRVGRSREFGGSVISCQLSVASN